MSGSRVLAAPLSILRTASRQAQSCTIFSLQVRSSHSPTLRCPHDHSVSHHIRATRSHQSIWMNSQCRSFTSTACLAARKRPSRTSSPETTLRQHSDSKLQPAPTMASHTEGTVSEGQAKNELTWRDYDPIGGMPLPGGELSQPQINAIFDGEVMDAETGNYVLSVMLWRRLSGALIDTGAGFPRDSGVTSQQALRGLAYIRSLDPDFDEQAAGQRYVEEEAEKLKADMRERAVKLGIYKPEEVEEEEDLPEEQQQGTEYGRARSGESALLKLRQENQRRHAAQQQAQELAEARAHLAAIHSARGPLELAGGVQPWVSEHTNLVGGSAGAVSIAGPQTRAWLQPVERKPWVKYYEEQASIIKENIVPQLSLARRLLPSLAVLLLTLGGCYLLAEHYTPPSLAARMFPGTPPTLATISTITALLVGSFLINRLPPLWRIYNKYFCITPGYPNAFGILGCSWRHDSLTHLLSNLMVLWAFGPIVHEDLGRGGFVALYIACGAVGSYTSLAYYVLRQRWSAYVLGASGNMLGLAGAVCMLHPYGTVQVFGQEIPMSGWALAVVGALLYGGAAYKGVPGIDHAGHFGGSLTGLAAGWLTRQRILAKGNAQTLESAQ